MMPWQPYGSERRVIEPSAAKRMLLALWGWRRIGPRIRFWHVRRALAQAGPTRVLELGCGWGQNLFALARRYPSAVCVGVEQDAGALAKAREIARDTAPEVTFVQATLPDLPVDGVFDLILLIDVLEYIQDDRDVLKRAGAALASGGRLLVHVPRRITTQRRVLPVSHAIDGHVRPEYTREEITAALRESGFSPGPVRATFGFWGTLAWELERLTERMSWLAVMLFPVLLGLAWLDSRVGNRDGCGYLILSTMETFSHGS